MPKVGEVIKKDEVCHDCGKEIVCVYQHWPRRTMEVVKIYELDPEKETAITIEPDGKSSCYCPHCGYKNIFDWLPY